MAVYHGTGGEDPTMRSETQNNKKSLNIMAGRCRWFPGFICGGGWGPIVTTTLYHKGRSPRFVIGSVSLFMNPGQCLCTFFTLLGVTHWQASGTDHWRIAGSWQLNWWVNCPAKRPYFTGHTGCGLWSLRTCRRSYNAITI